MRRLLSATLPVMLLINPIICLAGEETLGGSDDITSGEAGARAGTTVYNTFNPERQLPQSGGDVVQDTIKNTGAGKSVKDAWSDAAESNAAEQSSSHRSETLRSGSN